MLCKELQFGDWVTDEHGFPMQIIIIGNDYAYATFEGNEGDPWEFIDKDDPPKPIPLTAKILEKNGWEHNGIFMDKRIDENTFFSWSDKFGAELYQNNYYMCYCKYVHQLQQVLRIAGMTDMANNFKV